MKTEFDVRAVTHVVWTYATLGKYDQRLFDVCADSAAKLVDTASPQVSLRGFMGGEIGSGPARPVLNISATIGLNVQSKCVSFCRA